jgi:hypothetical protein
MVLPEINKRPVEPKLQPFLHFNLFWGRRGRVGSSLGVERVGLYGAEARVLAQAGHARDELVGTYAGVEDGVERRPTSRWSATDRDQEHGKADVMGPNGLTE